MVIERMLHAVDPNTQHKIDMAEDETVNDMDVKQLSEITVAMLKKSLFSSSGMDKAGYHFYYDAGTAYPGFCIYPLAC